MLERVKQLICIGHAHGDEIGFALKSLNSGDLLQLRQHALALGFELGGGGSNGIGMLERKFGGGQAQLVHIIRRHDLGQLVDDFGAAGGIAHAYAGKADFAHGAHQHQIFNLPRLRQKAVAAECAIGFVHHHNAGRGIDNGLHLLTRKAHAGGVVGIRHKHQRRPMRGNGLKHGRQIHAEIVVQRHTDIIEAVNLRIVAIHHKARLQRQHRSAGLGHQHGDELD